ncbi:RNA-binding domain-containing protein [Savagea faecisuis]|uniref:RNA-binding domain-containing protein n=1 Tax=Savagea faecisuis TaxID=1274803 RepID=A0ABW3GY71_9BACL
MKEARILEKLKKGESLTVEFKESKNKLNKDVFESVCAFLNRNGGHLFLGVKDDGKILGIEKDSVSRIKDNFVTLMNNPDKINPTFYLNVQEIEIEGKTILYILVPESSQVHRCSGKIYDRNEDADIDITNNTNLVSVMYMRKQSTYSENTIFPAVTLEELRADIFHKVKKLAANQRINHPWESMSNLDLLKSAGLFIKDLQSGQTGITLAGILIFGSDQLIFNTIPHYKTDAILRVENVDRYDDRDDIRTNLIDSYERLMQFVAKHLNDKFYLEKDQRVNIRDRIFREVVSNILIHREYLNPFPAKFIIEKHRVVTENSNKAHGNGMIDPENFSPFPKNPKIANFFKEIGWVDELGSGIRNIVKYNKIYSGVEAKFIEGDVFRTIIPLGAKENESSGDTGVDEETKKILEFCKTPRSRQEIQDYMGIKSSSYIREKVLNPLIRGGLLELTVPDKPTSPKQKYYFKEITPPIE